MKSTLCILIAAMLSVAPWSRVSAADTAAQFDLLKAMSVADYRATGLEKLSDAQIKALGTWIANYESQQAKNCAPAAAAVTPAVAAPAAAGSLQPATKSSKKGDRVSGDVVTSSRIKGAFSGWNGDTVFKLENGEVWQQSDDQVMTIAAMQHPEVTISKGAFNVYYLKVQGLMNSVQVQKVEPEDSN